MSDKKKFTPSTTGHTWDGDLQELNNPLPTWWIWGFYITFAFTIIYWMLYPAWPIGKHFTTGIPGLNTITYTAKTVDGKEVEKTTHWNMRSKFMHDMNEQEAFQKQYFDKVASMPYEAVSRDAELMQFVNSAGKNLFANNCAACHQSGGGGKIGFSPNLTDDYWQYGGKYEQISTTITGGRRGYMPPFKEVLNDEQITQLANYVLSMSGEPHDEVSAAAGNVLFHSETAACYYCHGAEGKGKELMGSANLTDKIWLWVNIPADKDAITKLNDIKGVIYGGLAKGVMPNWNQRLSPEQIKLLTVYVHDGLGGGS